MLGFENLKASDVLQAMVTGLLKSDDDPLFRVDMGTFGEVQQEICCGCAATATLAELYGEGKLASEMMLAYVKAQTDREDFDYIPLSRVIQAEFSKVQGSLPTKFKNLERGSLSKNIERGVNLARQGYVSALIEILASEVNESFDGRWHLATDDWKEQLPKIEATIAQMIAAGY